MLTLAPASTDPRDVRATLRDLLDGGAIADRRGLYGATWPAAGRVRVEWRLGAAVVAQAELERDGAGDRGTLALLPTACGERLLRRRRRVTVRATFTEPGGAPVAASAVHDLA